MKFTFSIIDHVGSKAGMDCYDSSLMKAFNKHNCRTLIFSNYIGIDSHNIDYKTCYEGHSQKGPFTKAFRFVRATFFASYQSHKKKADLVILHLFSANYLSLILLLIPKLFGLKIAVIAHDISSFINNDKPLVKNLIYNCLSDYIVVHNKYSYNELINKTEIKQHDKIKNIKHGGYLDHINNQGNKDSVRNGLGLKTEDKYILFFGQIKKVKGLDILINAIRKTDKDIKLIIAGRPWNDDFEVYQGLIEEYNLEARVTPIIRFIEDEERERLFLAADVIVLPYRHIYQSGVLLMAMSYGLPVIASDLSPNLEIIRNEKNGILFKSEDPNDLALKINQFFESSSLSEKMAKNALETIKQEYSWDDISLQYLKMVDDGKRS